MVPRHLEGALLMENWGDPRKDSGSVCRTRIRSRQGFFSLLVLCTSLVVKQRGWARDISGGFEIVCCVRRQ